MNILLAYGYSQEAVPAYLEEALQKEHRVVTCGPSKGRPQDIPCEPTAHVSEILARLPSDFSPDLFIWVESPVAFLPQGVETLAIPTVYYQTAALWNHVWGARYARCYDFVFINSQRLDVFERGGNRRVYPLKNACDSSMRADVNRERPIDIAFLGTVHPVLYPDRPRYLSRLMALAERHGLNIFVANGLYREKLHEIYQASKMVFNSGFMGEGLNMRVFEAMVCGSLALTNNGDYPGVSSYFTHGDHVVIYDEARLEELILHYLQHPNERQAIAQKGQAKVVTDHSYARPVAEIFAVLEAHGFAAQPREALAPAEQALDAACAFYFNQRLDHAWKSLRAAEQHDPTHHELPHTRAVLMAALGDPGAELAFLAALEAQPSPLTTLCYGHWLLRQGRPAEAERLVRNLPRFGIDWNSVLWGRIYYPYAWDPARLDWMQLSMSENAGEARAAFVHNERLSVLMEAALAQQHSAEARKHGLSLAMERPGDASLWLKIASQSGALGLHDEAIYQFHRALTENPFLLPARLGLATLIAAGASTAPPLMRACEVLEDNLKIGAAATRLLMIHPDSPLLVQTLNELGTLRAMLGQVELAKEAWYRSLELSPQQATIQALLDGRSTILPLPGMDEQRLASAQELPDRRGFNILAASSDPTHVAAWVAAYLGAFGEDEDVALHVLAGNAVETVTAAIVAMLETMGRDPERIPDISVLDTAPTSEELTRYLRMAGLVLGTPEVAQQARHLGIPAFTEPTPEALRIARGHFPTLIWEATPATSTWVGERWLVSDLESWEPTVATYVESVQPGDGTTLLIGVPSCQAETWEQRIGGWLVEHGYDPTAIPDIEIVEVTPNSLVSLYRQATAWIETGDPLGRAIAMSLDLPVRQLPTAAI